MAKILLRLLNLILIFAMAFAGCCAKPLPGNTPLSMSDEDIINQGEDAIIYVISLCKSLRACKKTRVIGLKREILKHYPRWSLKTKDAILNGQVFIGMTKKQALVSWGQPKRSIKTMAQRIVREQFVYGKKKNLYFENEILKEVQTQ